MCVLRNVADLSKHTISELQAFRIVVVSRALLASESYIERLAAFAGMPGLTITKGRSFTQWLRFVGQQIPDHLEVRRRGQKVLEKHIKGVYDTCVTSDEFKSNVPSKRLTGIDYIAGKEKKVKVNFVLKVKA